MLKILMMSLLSAVCMSLSYAQAPYPPQVPSPYQQPMQQPTPAGPQAGTRPLEYAFKPDLTNPQYGECLQLEKNWKNLYLQYYRFYEQARMGQAYGDYTYQINALRSQMDAAWNTFSGKCIYFPKNK